MLNFKAETLELMVRGVPLAGLAEHVCRHVERRFPGTACSILTVDAGGLLHILSAPSLPEHYLATIDNVAAGPDVGSCGAAAWSGQPIEAHDIACDPRWDSCRDLPIALGLKACWSSPFTDASGQVIATIALYFRECRGPTPGERAFVELCIHLCGLAMSRQSRIDDRERGVALDALTGLPNRGSFERTLSGLSCVIPRRWGLFIVDLDNLQMTNDTFGHAAGDCLLQEVAARLANYAAPDRVFRIGGDEFAVLVLAPERLAAPDRTAAEILARLTPPLDFGAFTLIPMATIGSASVAGSELDASVVYRNADTALYHAKETQVGGHVRFHSVLATRITARLSSIEAVQAALDEERIHAWYQPIVDLETGYITGFEALCRMITADGNVIPASVFREATTDARIAPALTERMLTQVARDMEHGRDLGIPLCPIGVNLSAIDLRGGKLSEALSRIFRNDYDRLRNLVVEVSENVYLGKRAQLIIDEIQSLRVQGIRVALDDFGTGYASLTHLLNLPVDVIKIDKSFIDRLPADELSATIISSIASIADRLGARVVAEGVETEDQAAALATLGCQACQGFLYGPGVPRSEAFRLAMRHSVLSNRAMPMMRCLTNVGGESSEGVARRRTG